jgi:hypothetical protein
MSIIVDQKELAGRLRSYFVEHLPSELLPVPRGDFSLDGLLDIGASMSLQITGGRTLRRYIDDTRIDELHFTIFYRDSIGQDNEAKSAMLGTLNGIGAWLELQKLPYLGDGFSVRRLEQIQAANVIAQTAQQITYQAGFVLGYETKGR